MSGAPAVAVDVCIATYRRPEGLERVLRGLDGLTFARTEPAPAVEVLVVDNDPEGSARATCDALRPTLRWPLRYAHEAERGLSAVRNRGVAERRPEAVGVAFIDDDMEPTPGWLDELLAARERYDADVVLGPTLRRFEGPIEPWIETGRFFEDPRYPTGTALEHGGIGNSLVDARVFSGGNAPFDPRWSLAGGEDTHFFLGLHEAGRRIVWADEAVAHEWIPASRANVGWILRRVYRTSNTWGQCEREYRGTPRVMALRALKGGARILYGLATLPIGVVRGRHAVVRSLWYICLGAGHLSGLMGMGYDEYRVTHGR